MDQWRSGGLAGLHDEVRPGRPRTHDDETVAELLARILRAKPDRAKHWSVRSAAAQIGISKSSVARYLSLCTASSAKKLQAV
ncbi:helix-turn-helix domain-containing protein [Paraburkholderia sp. J41]|uniref:helix-turn-helix domain-containing protein n=1 Tax=Paraburkholderia sp. J41 TaxID=2805433 RepID=UPI0039F56DBF